MGVPVVFQYQQALDRFRREGREPPLLKRMSELISLLDLTTTLSSSLSGQEILNAALLIVMGELRASRGVLFVRGEGGYEIRAARGLPASGPREAALSFMAEERVSTRASGRHREVFEAFGLELLCPIHKAGRTIAVLGVGPRADGQPYAEEEAGFLTSVAACAATPIENGLIYEELRRLNQKLSVKVFQLDNLFDISRELTASFDEDNIQKLVTSTLLGHLMVSRCALFLRAGEGLRLTHQRGLRADEAAALLPEDDAGPLLETIRAATMVSDLPAGPMRDRLLGTRMSLVVPLSLGGRAEGLLVAGERVSGAPFTEEDRDFASTLGRQALAALENVRLHRVQLEKLRQDRDLQIAKEIQHSLFPKRCPVLPGFAVAAESHSCYAVGGDYYDFIPLGGGLLGLAIGDVSGKGTPASILMASVHASLQALAGTAPLEVMMARLNRFLCASTQDNKYVTLFYAELDPASRRLVYVNAGHVPPVRLTSAGKEERLEKGGPALGLIEDAAYEVGEVSLASGDVVAMVTDGATEALSPADEEFGDERVLQALRQASGEAALTVRTLVDFVQAWTGPRGCSDDLTVLVLTAL